MTSCSQCSQNYCLASATTPCRCVGWTWPNSDCYIIFFFITELYYMMHHWCFSSKQFSWQWGKQEVQSQSKGEWNQIKTNQRHDRALLRTDDKPTTSLPEPWTRRVIREPWTSSLAVVGHLCPSPFETRARVMLLWREPGLPWWMCQQEERTDKYSAMLERKITEQMLCTTGIALRLHCVKSETLVRIST